MQLHATYNSTLSIQNEKTNFIRVRCVFFNEIIDFPFQRVEKSIITESIEGYNFKMPSASLSTSFKKNITINIMTLFLN